MNDAGLAASALTRRCDPRDIPFETTEGVAGSTPAVGQERAARALRVAIGVPGIDYNAFVMGPAGSGRHRLVQAELAREAARGAVPSDWAYVHNFQAPQRPLAIELPPGKGAALRDGMCRLVDELRSALPAIFESEDYSHRVEKIEREIGEKREAALNEISADAQRQQITLLRTPAGFIFAPTKGGEVVATEQFESLPEEERERIAAAIAALQGRLEQAIREAMRGRRERARRLAELDSEMVMLALQPLIEDLAQRYAAFPKVTDYLNAVRDDLVENSEDFRRAPEGRAMALGAAPLERGMHRYSVNVLVDRSASNGPEVLFCDHPTYANLVGRIEHVQHLGTLLTDFTLLKAGALHGANGGYLVIDALKLLTQPFAWEALKRTLWRREIRIEPVGELWGIAASSSIEPEPIPLSVKVVLIGERHIYYLLQAFDPDFARLFKVVADFEESVERSAPACAELARCIAGIATDARLMPLDRGAVARMIDESARRASDSRRLSTDLESLTRLAREADFLAREDTRVSITAADVAAAAEAQRARLGRIKRRIDEEICRGGLVIDTSGEQVGQVNGLAVIDMGELAFGVPTRITATTRLGDGQVIDIQREARLGGAVHSKGVMILSQFLAARFSAKHPHSLTASLVFEQTYGPVEGDSASLAELCALLSSLANAPLRQSIAVTGSVDQRGDVQAVGAVNEKIEGFFDVCRERGLDGSHAVVIPASSVEQLVLCDAVVEAVGASLFHVFPVATVDAAMELLTGMRAGVADSTGAEAAATVNGRVARRLRDFARERAQTLKIEMRSARGGRAPR